MGERDPSVLVRPLVAAQSIAEVGGKAASLGALLRAGLPVPEGLVITTAAFDALQEQAGEQAGGHADRESSSREQMLAATWPTDVANAITGAFDALDVPPSDRWTVRSSGTAEDSATQSFAGQHDTFYGVSRADLLDAIRRCFASLWSEHAAAYRTREPDGVKQAPPAQMAVIVQRLIDAKVSGVTFSQDPLAPRSEVITNTGPPNELREVVTHATWGMGAALVDGRVTPDQFRYRFGATEPPTISVEAIGSKALMCPPGTSIDTLVDVPEDLQRRACLSDAQVTEIANLALACERHFGSPQDIEWAFDGQSTWLVQSRPITAAAPAKPLKTVPAPIRALPVGDEPQPVERNHGDRQLKGEPRGEYLLFKPAAENFMEPLTPLSADIFGRLARCFGGRIIDGWLYLDMRVLRFVIPLDLNRDELVDVAYLAGLPPRYDPHLLRAPVTLVVGTFVLLLTAIFGMRTRHLADHAFDRFRDLVNDVASDNTIGPLRAAERLYLGHRLLEPIGNMPLLANVSAGRYFIAIGLARAALSKWAPDLGLEALARLTAGDTGVRSVQMNRALQDLAALARATPEVAVIFREPPDNDIGERLRAAPAANDFIDAFARFIDAHGHRGARELELAAPRWREAPEMVLALIRNQVIGDSVPPTSRPSDLAARREAAEQALDEALGELPLEQPFRPRRLILDALFSAARYYSKLRENTRYFHIMVVDVVRTKALQVADQLVSRGALQSRDDVFFMTADEIERTTANLSDRVADDTVATRKAERAHLIARGPRKTVGFEMAEAPAAQPDDAAILSGQAASPGQFEGVARVLRDPTRDGELRPGEVLIAPYTDPAWTPLFLTAGAAVVEVGSYLSHAGTVARELGLPCVVDVRECTHRIRTGDLIRVDADRGEVHIIKRTAQSR